MNLSIEEQVAYFKTLSHEEQLSKVKGMLSIIGDEVTALRGLKQTVDSFEESVSGQDLSEIFESILLLVKKYQESFV